MEKSFQLQDEEEIIKEIKPLPVLRWYFFLRPSMAFVWLPITWLFVFIRIGGSGLVSFLGLILFASFFVFVIVLFILSGNRYKYQHYWITNKRVLYRRGLLGYTISSIPLERISDVIVSRTFWERVFGFGSIHIQSLAGQVTFGRRMGAEGSLLAVSDPEGTQKLIFDLIKIKRKKEHLTM